MPLLADPISLSNDKAQDLQARRSAQRIRLLAAGGALAVVLTILLVGAIDVLHALEAESLRRFTLSEHALGPHRLIFSAGVLLLSAGSGVILAVLVHGGLTRWRSAGAIALSAWILGLALAAIFPKYNWAVGPSLSGAIHRFSSVLAFFSLPVAVLLLALPWLRHETWRRHARWTFGLGLLSAFSLTPILFAVLVYATVGTPWWLVVPLGYVERLLVIHEVIAVLVLALWARAAAHATP